MTGQAVRIGPDDMWALLDHVDLVGALREGLRGADARPGELSTLDSGLLAFRDESTAQCGVLPAEDLHSLCTAGLAALAARLLLANGVITASVTGPRPPTQWHLGVIGRYVPNVSHVAVFTSDRTEAAAVDPRVLDHLDLAGIGISVATSVADAVLGATLVVALGEANGQIGYDQLTRGSLMISADGHPVSDDLRDGVARRYSVGDLARVLAGDHAGRVPLDEIRLVELADPGWLRDLETVLARRLVKTALRVGAGVLHTDGAHS